MPLIFVPDDSEVVPVVLDRAARVRLANIAAETGEELSKCAAALLATLLAEDEFFNGTAAGRDLN